MINADDKQISTDFLYKDLTYAIRGAIFQVFNTLGNGHKEQVYQRALGKELELRNMPFKREMNLLVEYKGEQVGTYRPDFIIDGKVIIELKAVEFMSKTYEMQLLHYLKATTYKVGLLVNFGSSRIDIKRLIWSSNL